MVKQTIYIENFDWVVHAYFHKSHYDVEEIMERLWDLGCDASTARSAYENLTNDELNMGLCYSNYRNKETVLVIGKTSSSAEFLNSLVHELTHLQSHVCNVFCLDPMGEEIAYFTGDLSREMYPSIKGFLCECCRRKEYKDEEM